MFQLGLGTGPWRVLRLRERRSRMIIARVNKNTTRSRILICSLQSVFPRAGTPPHRISNFGKILQMHVPHFLLTHSPFETCSSLAGPLKLIIVNTIILLKVSLFLIYDVCVDLAHGISQSFCWKQLIPSSNP